MLYIQCVGHHPLQKWLSTSTWLLLPVLIMEEGIKTFSAFPTLLPLPPSKALINTPFFSQALSLVWVYSSVNIGERDWSQGQETMKCLVNPLKKKKKKIFCRIAQLLDSGGTLTCWSLHFTVTFENPCVIHGLSEELFQSWIKQPFLKHVGCSCETLWTIKKITLLSVNIGYE